MTSEEIYAFANLHKIPIISNDDPVPFGQLLIFVITSVGIELEITDERLEQAIETVVAWRKLVKADNRVKTAKKTGTEPYGAWEGEAEVVQLVLDMHQASHTLRDIAKKLNELDYRTRMNKEFRSQQIKDIIDRNTI